MVMRHYEVSFWVDVIGRLLAYVSREYLEASWVRSRDH